MMYIDLRPDVSQNEDQNKGNMASESIYNPTDRLVIVGVVSRPIPMSMRDAIHAVNASYLKAG